MSSTSKSPSPYKNNMNNHESQEEEESGWTTYFEDFFNNQNNNNVVFHDDDGHDNNSCSMIVSNFSCGLENSSASSLVSDAATKLNDESVKDEGLCMSKKGNISSFKKRKKVKTALVDDSLEDTASSPVNSPKVLYERQLYKANHHQQVDHFQEKGNGSGQRDERRELGFNGRDSDSSELKKKGLCLVPLSMVLKYLG